MAEESNKIGAGHASAMARLGLRELRGAMYPESNVAQQPELGLYGTATPHEVHQSRHGESPASGVNDRDVEQDSVLQERLQQAESRQDMSRDDKNLDRE